MLEKKIDTFKPIRREKREDVFEARFFSFKTPNYTSQLNLYKPENNSVLFQSIAYFLLSTTKKQFIEMMS